MNLNFHFINSIMVNFLNLLTVILIKLKFMKIEQLIVFILTVTMEPQSKIIL